MAIERQHRPIDKEFEEADYSGCLDISGRKLRLFPNIGDDVYEPLEIFTASESLLFVLDHTRVPVKLGFNITQGVLCRVIWFEVR